jgi:TPR repeat protein
MANDTGIKGWTLISSPTGGEKTPCFMHATDNKALVVSWDDVPIEKLTEWANENVLEAIFQLGKVKLDSEDYDAAWTLFNKGAEENDMYCYFYLGVMLDQGLGVKQNRIFAIQKYQQAADLGHGDSQYNVAQAYMFGNGAQKNYQKALFYFKASADNGDAESAFNAGILLSSGIDIEPNIPVALKYFIKANELGDERAIEMIKKFS